jgi:hypothetical protein
MTEEERRLWALLAEEQRKLARLQELARQEERRWQARFTKQLPFEPITLRQAIDLVASAYRREMEEKRNP